MVDATPRVAKIMEECGFVKNLLEAIDVNQRIRELENQARKTRDEQFSDSTHGVLRTPLTDFLPKNFADELQILRLRKQQLKEEDERNAECARKRISDEDIVLVKSKKGIFAEKAPFKAPFIVKDIKNIKRKDY